MNHQTIKFELVTWMCSHDLTETGRQQQNWYDSNGSFAQVKSIIKPSTLNASFSWWTSLKLMSDLIHLTTSSGSMVMGYFGFALATLSWHDISRFPFCHKANDSHANKRHQSRFDFNTLVYSRRYEFKFDGFMTLFTRKCTVEIMPWVLLRASIKRRTHN